MKRALPLLALMGGCALRDPRVTAAPCASSAQCSRSDVCFLGECRAPATNLSIVSAEVRPPSGSPFALRTSTIDLSRSVLNDFTVTVPLNIGDPATPGAVTQAQDGAPPAAVPNAIVTFSDHAPVIPDRIEQIVSPPTDASGAYHARIPQGTWDVVVQPPAPLPPIRFGVLDTSAPDPNFVVPSFTSLPQLDGGVTVDGGLPLAGASVTAVDASGAALSSAVKSQADGHYSLYLAPDAGFAKLQIGPFTGADGGPAPSAALDPFPTYQPRPYAPSVEVPLPPVVTLSGRVLDAAGAPVPAARVYARSVNPDWTLARSAIADGGGAYAIPLRSGDYLVQAAPSVDPTSPALSIVQPITLGGSSAMADLACPLKVHRNGRVFGPDGRQVSGNFQVIATRLTDALISARMISTTTDPTGYYEVVADAGRWRFEVVPPAEASLPRTIVQFDLDPADPGPTPLPAIRISPPLEAVGTVRGSKAGSPEALVSGAQVSFFALDAAGQSVSLGSALTDSQGRYQAILPDVAQATTPTP